MHVKPPWKIYEQHTSHQVNVASSQNVCPSPFSSLTRGSLAEGSNIVLTSGGLKPLFLDRCPQFSAALGSASLCARFGETRGLWGDGALLTLALSILDLALGEFFSIGSASSTRRVGNRLSWGRSSGEPTARLRGGEYFLWCIMTALPSAPEETQTPVDPDKPDRGRMRHFSVFERISPRFL